MSLINKPAPKFTAPAVINGNEIVKNFSLEQYIGQKSVVLFFYPKDFSGLCPSELIAYQNQLADFEALDCAVVGCSTDTEETHLTWLSMPQSKGGIQGITYPIVADVSKTIANNFGVLGGEYYYNDEGEFSFEGAPIALRGTFLINKKGIIKHCLINDFPIGRNIEESLRMVEAHDHLEKHGQICLANWKKNA
ncbi:MAG: peroxiredoxin [Cytophagales bacterium]|nr:MAG: peroxiredoxin [Cytophagales bacterium]TAF59870.1 MAG: peroxiredoxin [Cytophagales bacterium]